MLNIGQTADTLWTNHLPLRRRQTKMEIDEDWDGRRRRQTKPKTKTKIDLFLGRAKWQLPYSWRHPRVTKTEADEDGDSEDEDRLTLGTSEAAAPVQLTTPQSDKASHATRWLPSPWRMQQSLQPQVQSCNRPSPLVPELTFRKTLVIKRWQSPQVVPTGLTEDEPQNFLHYGLNWTTSCLLRSWQSSAHMIFSVP